MTSEPLNVPPAVIRQSDVFSQFLSTIALGVQRVLRRLPRPLGVLFSALKYLRGGGSRL